MNMTSLRALGTVCILHSVWVWRCPNKGYKLIYYLLKNHFFTWLFFAYRDFTFHYFHIFIFPYLLSLGIFLSFIALSCLFFVAKTDRQIFVQPINYAGLCVHTFLNMYMCTKIPSQRHARETKFVIVGI